MCPGGEFAVVTGTEPDGSPFNAVVRDRGITVWVNAGRDADVFDKHGKPDVMRAPASRRCRILMVLPRSRAEPDGKCCWYNSAEKAVATFVSYRLAPRS